MNRKFGAFQCTKCHRRWMSAYTWADTAQECKSCKIPVLPYEQKPLEKPEGLDKSDATKKHIKHLCGKCKNKSYSCAEQYSRYY